MKGAFDLLESQTPFSASLWCSVCVQPGEQRANAPLRQSDARVGSTVVKVDAVAIPAECVAASKHNIVHIPEAFVSRFRAED
jgi:uncharacterized protein YcnI